MRAHARSGYTVLEIAIAVALLSIVMMKVTVLLRETGRVQEESARAMTVEDRARRVLDQIAYALMATNGDTLLPALGPDTATDEVQYEFSLGVEEGEVVWSDPHRIAFSDDLRSVEWWQDPGGPGERRVVWTNIARPTFEGEETNGADDNGNGLADETGLHFLIDGANVTIRLTLEQIDERGNTYVQTAETTVTCRNFAGGGA